MRRRRPLRAAATGKTGAAMVVTNQPIVVGFAAASCLADLLVILTACSFPRGDARLNFSVRYVNYFAVANLVSSGIGLFNNVGAPEPIHPLCTTLGLVEWWATWSSWFWTAAIADAFYRSFRDHTLEVSKRCEVCRHAVCWVGPAVLLAVAHAAGNEFGDDTQGVGLPALEPDGCPTAARRSPDAAPPRRRCPTETAAGWPLIMRRRLARPP